MDIKSTLTLNNNVEIPILGLGMYLNSSGNIARNALKCAIKAGYRHFDTAKFYANERDVGQAIRESDIPRDELPSIGDGVRRNTRQRSGLLASLPQTGRSLFDPPPRSGQVDVGTGGARGQRAGAARGRIPLLRGGAGL